jgi:hypothetical protein
MTRKSKVVIEEPTVEQPVEAIALLTSTLDLIIDTASTIEGTESEAPKIHYLRLLLAKLKTETT